MSYWSSRSELLLGPEAMERLKKAHVIIAGLGGVGAAAAELVCRAGVGKMTLVDADVVEASNRNRQWCALVSTDGKSKAEVFAERLRDINPEVQLKVVPRFLKDDFTRELLDAEKIDYALDCIDTLAPKVFYIYDCWKRKIPIVSSMGAGGKVDPGLIRIADISETYTCNLAKRVRERLHNLGIDRGIRVVFSPENVDQSRIAVKEGLKNKKSIIGTISYLPPLFGSFCASVAIRELCGLEL